VNPWLPQASYPCSNFSVTSCFNIQNPTSIEKGSLGHAYTFRIHTGNDDINTAFGLLLPRMISVHAERCFGTPALLFYRCAAPAKLPIKRVSQEYIVSPRRRMGPSATIGELLSNPRANLRHTRREPNAAYLVCYRNGLTQARRPASPTKTPKRTSRTDELLTLSSMGRTHEAACRSQFT